ncbi:hypothetical protein [Streptomyces sp. NPDC085540]
MRQRVRTCAPPLHPPLREGMLREVTADLDNVRVESSNDLLVD